MKKKYIAVLVLAMVLLSACSFTNLDDDNRAILQKFDKTYYYMDTVSRVQMYYDSTVDADLIDTSINDLLERFDSEYNSYSDSSVISDVNNNAYKEPYKVSDEMFDIIEIALDYAAKYEGAYDPTVMPLSLLWAIDSDSWKCNNVDYANATGTEIIVKTPPTDEAIQDALQYVGYENVTLNEKAKTVSYSKEGVMLDLGGIVKGYIANEIYDLLKDSGIGSAIINCGNSSQIFIGNRPSEVVGDDETTYRYSNDEWYIGLEEPKDDNHTSNLGIYRYSDGAISSSGEYLKYFDYEGIRYHHIFNPITGYPVDNDLVSVCVFTTDYKSADALSTMLFCIGLDKAIEYVNDNDLDAYLITDDDEIYISSNSHEFQLQSSDAYAYTYTIKNY